MSCLRLLVLQTFDGDADVEVNGLVEDIGEDFGITFDAVDVYGSDATGDVIVQDGELDVPDQERLPGSRYAAQFQPAVCAFRKAETGPSQILIHLEPRTEEVLLPRFPGDKNGRGQFLFL